MKIFCLLLVFLFAASSIEATRRWCFYTNWAQYRTNGAKFVPEDIDATLCTHISYAFGAIKRGSLAPFEWNDDDTGTANGMFKRVNSLKHQNPNLKTLLAVGGWNMGSDPFTAVVRTKQSRENFITTAISFLRSRDFDGLDICWEYPTRRGSPVADKTNYGLLLKELRAAFEENAKITGLPRLLLAVSVGADENLIEEAYDLKAMTSAVDAISILSYDFYTARDTKFAVHTSALHAGNISKGVDGKKNVEYAAKSWVSHGAPKDLINIGIALYGHSYKLETPNTLGEGAPITGAGSPGESTRLAGFLAYFEVCDMIDKGATVGFIEDRGVPFLVLGNQWVAFENKKSVELKAKFAVDGGYGGVMVWSFDVDDFSGKCTGGQHYPLLRTIYNAVEKNVPIVTKKPDTISIKDICTKNGDGLVGISCNEFIICNSGTGFKSQCADGQVWIKSKSKCDVGTC